MKLNYDSKIIVSLYAIICAFWATLVVVSKNSLVSDSVLETLQHLTQVPLAILPILGGVIGIKNSLGWGGMKSVVGRSSLGLALGLTAWGMGMVFWNYYLFFADVEIPYPSWADLGYALGLVFFAIGIFSLSGAVGVRFALRDKKGKILIFLIPTIVILFSIHLLINVARGGVLVDPSGSYLKLFFDLLYPLGDVVLLTITALVYFLSKDYLGGRYKLSILVLFAGFLMFYISDFTFSYTTTTETYFNGHFVDFLFTTTMFILSLGLAMLDVKLLRKDK